MAFRHQENTVFRRVLCKLRNPVVARDLRFQPALKKGRRRTMEVIMSISWGPFPGMGHSFTIHCSVRRLRSSSMLQMV